jgi:hypothetical protein
MVVVVTVVVVIAGAGGNAVVGEEISVVGGAVAGAFDVVVHPAMTTPKATIARLTLVNILLPRYGKPNKRQDVRRGGFPDRD